MDRREALTGLTATAVLLFTGCERPKPTPVPPESKNLPPLRESDVKDAARIAISDFNKVLGLSLKESVILPNIVLVSELSEYQKIIAAQSTNYVPQDETNRWAITTHPGTPYAEKIFVFKPAIEKVTELLPDTAQGRQARTEFLAYVLGHECVHFSAKSYKSRDLHNIVFGKMLANSAPLKGKSIEADGVLGAQLIAKADGQRIGAFQSVEETEAILIGDLIARKNGRPKVSRLPQISDFGYFAQIDMYRQLLTKVYPGLDEGLKNLAILRMQEGGREKFAEVIEDKYQLAPDEKLFFAMSVLYAIDRGDQNRFNFYLNLPKK